MSLEVLPQWWVVDHIEVREVCLDWPDMLGGTRTAHAAWAGEVCLFNLLEFAKLTNDPAQFVICDSCGQTGCAGGGWASLRRFGEFIVCIPAFDKSFAAHNEAQKGFDEADEFAPPAYFAERGLPVFPLHTFAQLQASPGDFPAVEQIQPLTAGDAVWLMQFFAPLHVLGTAPRQPVLLREAVIAVADGELGDERKRLEEFLGAHFGSGDAIAPISSGQMSAVEFYLDGSGFPAWRPIVRHGELTAFYFEPFGAFAEVDRGRSL